MNLNGALLFNCNWKNIKIQKLNKLDGHSGSVYSVCFSPDGNTLASGSDDKSIHLLDAKKGEQQFELEGHDGTVYSVCFSPDGNHYHLVVGISRSVYGMLKQEKKFNQQPKVIMIFWHNLKLHYFKTILFQKSQLILQYYLYLKHQYFNQKELQFQRGEFLNQQGIYLRPLLKSKGSLILKNQVDLKQK